MAKPNKKNKKHGKKSQPNQQFSNPNQLKNGQPQQSQQKTSQPNTAQQLPKKFDSQKNVSLQKKLGKMLSEMRLLESDDEHLKTEAQKQYLKVIEGIPQDFQKTAIRKLSQAGYHRARVIKLSAYDRIIGGMTWALGTALSTVDQEVWKFMEAGMGEHDKKTVEEMKIDSSQIRRALKILGFELETAPEDFEQMEVLVLDPALDFALSKLREQIVSKKHYACFSGCFNTRYEDEEAAADDFKSSLRRPSDIYYSDEYRMKLFDFGMLRDEDIDAGMMLTAYVHYAETGEKVYPPNNLCDQIKFHDIFIGESRYKEGREELEKLKETKFNTMTEDIKAVVAELATIIEKLDVANFIKEFDSRFSAEARAYYSMYLDHERLKKQVETLKKEKDYFHAQSFSNEFREIQTLVEQTVDRANKFHKELSRVFLAVIELDEEMCSNKDKDGNWKKYCPHRRDAAEKQHEKTKKLLSRMTQTTEMIEAIVKSYDVFSKTYWRRADLLEDGNESTSSTLLINAIDENLPDDLLKLSEDIGKLIDKVNVMPDILEATEFLYRDAFLSYVSDTRCFFEDYRGKALIMLRKRESLCEMIMEIQEDIETFNLFSMCTNREASKLHEVSRNIFTTRNHLKKWEKEFEEMKKNGDFPSIQT